MKLIVDHKWFCIRCSKLWTLRVNDEIESDLEKLNNFSSEITKHCLTNIEDDRNHEIIHKQKDGGFQINYA